MTTTLTRILYVEDDADIQAVGELALAHVGGFTVELCSSGQEALDKVADFQPELILLDVMMPGIDGIETYQALKELGHLENTPVVFMTAKVQEEDLARYRQLGIADIISKPFDPMSLSDRIRNIWQQCQH
ncbi:MAG: response regulator [Saccharospirillum sp.]|nr:response regulator [Saccharospirillum sp.]